MARQHLRYPITLKSKNRRRRFALRSVCVRVAVFSLFVLLVYVFTFRDPRDSPTNIRHLRNSTIQSSVDTHTAIGEARANRQPWLLSEDRLPEDESCFVADTSKTKNTQRQKEDDVSLPLPIINVGMPKVGSTTLAEFFECGKIRNNHWRIQSDDGRKVFVGQCMREAVEMGLPPFEFCEQQVGASNHFDAWLQMDFLLRDECIFPQLLYLEEIHQEHPNATLILISRPVEDWLQSLVNWKRMDVRIQNNCGFQREFDRWSDNPLEKFRRFWCDHVNTVRRFVEAHPSHNLLELDLYDTSNAEVMSSLFSVESACWGHGKDSQALAAN